MIACPNSRDVGSCGGLMASTAAEADHAETSGKAAKAASSGSFWAAAPPV